MRTHIVKSWPQFFGPICAGRRTHELRKNDRNYQVGDLMELNEFLPDKQTYTGHKCLVEITSITSNQEPCAVSEDALKPEFCILSVARAR